MMIKKFIETYNRYITNKNVRFKDLNYEYGIITKAEEVEDVDNLLEELVLNYIYPEASCLPAFVPFDQEILQNSIYEHWLSFAEYKNYNWFYVWDTSTDQVVLVDTDTNEVDHYCGKNFICFIEAMQLVLDLKAVYFLEENSVSEEYLREILSQCIEIAGGEKYGSFYKFILGVLD